MSIYIYTQKLREILDGEKFHLPDEKANSIVASGISGKRPHIMKLENYSEDKLIDLLLSEKKYKHLYVDYRFWNYKYCKIRNLRIENLKHLYPGGDELFVDPTQFYVGMVVVMIMYYQIFYYTYLIEKEELFKVYLDRIGIDKGDMARFMIDNKIYLPVTTNYIHLLVRVFTDRNISDYLFDGPYKPRELRLILENFNVTHLRYYAKTIFESERSLLDKYLAFEVVLDLFDGSIDQYPNVYMTDTMIYKPVGYYLRSDDIPDDLVNFNQSLVETYLLKDGSDNIKTI